MLTADTGFISLVIYLFLVAMVIAVMLASRFLGERHSGPGTATPYESGILVTGNARVKFAAHFYLVAMFFVVFDLESVFLYAWSISIRELGVVGLLQAAIFIFILFVTLVYLFRIGAFKIGPVLRKPERERS